MSSVQVKIAASLCVYCASGLGVRLVVVDVYKG